MTKQVKFSILLTITATIMLALTWNDIKIPSTAFDTPEEAYDKALSEIEKARDNKDAELRLEEKGLSKLPAEIGELAELQELYINFNMLSSLPPQIGKLTALKCLFVDGNYLTDLPREIGQLSNLESLSFAMNRITCLPEEIGKLSNLKCLWLSDNYINRISYEISQLKNIVCLDLRHNKIKTLPSSITEMNMEILWEADGVAKGINLYGNPLEEPSIEIVKQGNAAIKQYFEDKSEGKGQ
ncbi:MAG: leucine-rich repeat domain-containing protein [Phycisphaerae bacterium]|nr:leucine-rich repeat domain-containing protein [Phycisphaerae bacterium]